MRYLALFLVGCAAGSEPTECVTPYGVFTEALPEVGISQEGPACTVRLNVFYKGTPTPVETDISGYIR